MVSTDRRDELRRQDRVMRRVRLAAAAFAVLQFAVYQAPGDLEAPWPAVALGLGIGAALVAISAASHLVAREASEAALRRSGVAQLVGDAAVTLVVIWTFAFEPGSMVWSLMVLPVVEGALRFGVAGALGTWLGLLPGYVGGEVWAAATYEQVVLRPTDLSFAVGLVGVVAVSLGAVVRHLHQVMTRHREAERRLRALVYLDALTRLPNRARLLGTLDRLDGGGDDYAVAFLDLDGFKAVNDRYGHEAGDEVLRAVAHRLGEAVRPTDLVARLAGDEFVVVAPGVSDLAEAGVLADRLVRAGRTHVVTEGGEVPVRASVGVALGRGGATPGRVVLQRADAAMYEAKAAGGSAPVVVDASDAGAPAGG